MKQLSYPKSVVVLSILAIIGGASTAVILDEKEEVPKQLIVERESDERASRSSARKPLSESRLLELEKKEAREFNAKELRRKAAEKQKLQEEIQRRKNKESRKPVRQNPKPTENRNTPPAKQNNRRPSNSNHVAPGGIAACIRKYESGGNYRALNPSSGASGAYQFLDSTWKAVTGLPGKAMNYSPSIQDAAFYKLWNNGRGANQWVTAGRCGY